MGYRNRTYVIFDGDNDMWAYAYMKGWKSNDNIAFNFHDAHDLRPLTIRASDDTVRARLHERFSNSKQVVVLVGESTKNLYKFVRWEIEIAKGLDVPIVVVNLNGRRSIDTDRCPAVLRDYHAVHVAFKAAIIQYALDHFPASYQSRNRSESGPRYYRDAIYSQLGL